MELRVFSNPEEVARAAAQHFVEQHREAVARSKSFSVALSGGSTPKLLYELLANQQQPFREQIAWDKTYFFFTDERHVPPAHPDSNYRMANEALLSRVPLAKNNVHRIHSENLVAD